MNAKADSEVLTADVQGKNVCPAAKLTDAIRRIQQRGFDKLLERALDAVEKLRGDLV